MLAWIVALCAVGLALALYVERRGYIRRVEEVNKENEVFRRDFWQISIALKARDRAEAANDAKSRFLADISHDIRTPLSGMVGMADLLTGTKLDGEQATYAAAIRNAGDQLQQLVETLLDFSRIEAGKFVVNEVEFDLSALVESVVELLSPRAQSKSIEIAALVRPDVPQRITGDPMRLQQILMNLAGNAVKFTEHGGVGIEVRRAEDKLEFFVRDTGPGISPDRRTAIFEPYEQIAPDGQTLAEGTGLGLAITRRIVTEMGGELRLTETASGTGAEFTFTQPLRFAEARPYDQPLLRLPVRGKRVLIVADSPFEAPYLAQKLATVGVAVTQVATALAAQAALGGDERFDAVLIDHGLSSETAQKLANAARLAGVGQCLILLAPFERSTFGQVSAQGFDGWLTRPVRAKSLLRMIAQVQPEPEERLATPSRNLPMGTRILIAEDNDINALVMMRQCERLGAEVARVSDGAAALSEAFTSPAPDCILLDLRLPDMDGGTVARAIRAREQKERLAPRLIIAVSASTSADAEAHALTSGCDHFAAKPLDPAALLILINSPTQAPRRASA